MIQTGAARNLLSAPVNDHLGLIDWHLLHTVSLPPNHNSEARVSPVQQIALSESHSESQLQGKITGHTTVITVFIDS